MPENRFKTNTYVPYREDWLRLRAEDALDPDLPIIDPHHHIWDHPRPRYMAEELASDLACGHNIIATVFVECRSSYHTSGPAEFRPVGEVAFIRNLAESGAKGAFGRTRACDKAVGHADLTLGQRAVPVLERMVEAGGGRVAGIRQSSATDSDPAVIAPAAAKPPGLLLDPRFREGFSHLAAMGLSFDAFLYHPQIADLTNLARAFPDTNIILDHLGCPIGIGSYASRRDEIFEDWKASLTELARCPNVSVKLGGLGMQLAGFTFHHQPEPPSSAELAAAWRPYMETCIDLFGCERGMFESNFPPDKGTCSYTVLWNCFKRIAGNFSIDEKAALFHKTAARVYGITL